jgi:hypothetical protein
LAKSAVTVGSVMVGRVPRALALARYARPTHCRERPPDLQSQTGLFHEPLNQAASDADPSRDGGQ